MDNNPGGMMMIQKIFNSTWRAYRAMNLANKATDPAERNRHLVQVGWLLVVLGSLCLAAVTCFIMKLLFSGDPANLKAIILGFVTVAGFTGIVMGTIIQMFNNPGRFLHLINFFLCAVTLGAAMAVGLILAAMAP